MLDHEDPHLAALAGAAPSDATPSGDATLDPEDWDAFRALAHQMVDVCVDRLAGARDAPWLPVPATVKARFDQPAPQAGSDPAEVMAAVRSDILPYATGNTHPRFYGWVHGAGVADGLLAAMVEAAMNSNCGGRDHGALYVEKQVVDWMAELFGFGPRAGGLLVSGASMATLLGLVTARRRLRERIDPEIPAELCRVYAGANAHTAVEKAVDVIGLPKKALRKIPLDAFGRMDPEALDAAIAADWAAGRAPMAVVGTLGAVETGASDDLHALADVARANGVWLHLDGAFGAWARLAEAPWAAAADGIERADSLAFDFHKWPSVGYDCGCLLVRDAALHRRAFSNRPNYLTSAEAGLAGGDPWFCDYGVELSRGFRALKVWTALKTHGLDGLGRIVTKNCRQAQLMAARVRAQAGFALAFEPSLNVVCFHPIAGRLSDAERDALAVRIAAELQLDGVAVFSTVRLEGRVALRAAIVNHRATDADIRLAVDAAAAKRAEILAR